MNNSAAEFPGTFFIEGCLHPIVHLRLPKAPNIAVHEARVRPWLDQNAGLQTEHIEVYVTYPDSWHKGLSRHETPNAGIAAINLLIRTNAREYS